MSEPPTVGTAPAPAGVPRLAEASALASGIRVLDLRDAESFARGHAEGAGQLTAEELATRRMELPAREDPVVLVHENPEVARETAALLAARGYGRVAWLTSPISGDPLGLVSHAPAARLWSPSRFVERVVAPLAAGRALDLACGSGRAAVWLASLGWQAEAWDVDASALELAAAFAARHGVTLSLRQVDLEQGAPAAPAPPFDLIVVVRYLHRALFPWIERSLAPGGSLVYETFLTGQRRFGPPRRPRHLLEPGELRRSFPTLEVLAYEESTGEEPPVMASLHARRPD